MLFLCAPFIADFYMQPELTTLIQFMGLVVFINAAKVVQVAVLSREMDFKSQMKANTLGVVISGCLAVNVSWQGLGVWSLVLQMLVTTFVSTVTLWFVSSWRPTLNFSFVSFKKLFSFSKSLLVEGMLEVVFQNSYVLVIGKFFSAEITGLYFLAKKINNLISQQLTNAVQKATFPALSTLQNDDAKLKNKYREIMQVMMFIITPVMALLLGLAPALFELAFDPKRQSAVPYLQLLCVAGVLYPLHALNMNLLNVKGRPHLILKIGLLKKVVSLLLLFLAIPHGALGIIASQVLSSILALIPNIYFSSRLISYSFSEQMKDAMTPMLSAVVAGWVNWVIVYSAQDWLLLHLFVGAFLSIGVYLTLTAFFKAGGCSLIFTKIKTYKVNGKNV